MKVTTEGLNYAYRRKWFKDRIGKRIFRNGVSCNCKHCTNIEHAGLIINDDQHACYLNDCSCEMNIHYSDTKEGLTQETKQ